MIPIGDENRREAPRPYVNYTLIALNIIVFVYMLFLSQASVERFIYSYGVIPANIVHGQDLYTLLTSTFIHGGWVHIIGNMVFLWVFGDNIEAALGHGLYAIFYLGAGILAGLAHVVFNAQSTIPSIGASGAIAGTLGAYVVLFPGREVRVWIVPLIFLTARANAWIFLGVWAGMQLFTGLASLGVQTAQTGGVAVWAHVGGFATGLAIGALARGAGRETRG